MALAAVADIDSVIAIAPERSRRAVVDETGHHRTDQTGAELCGPCDQQQPLAELSQRPDYGGRAGGFFAAIVALASGLSPPEPTHRPPQGHRALSRRPTHRRQFAGGAGGGGGWS